MDLRKTKYILPNLFTLSSVFAAFYSIVLTSRADNAKELAVAAWLIIISMVLDGCDGRVARATRTQSEFGMQMDSLADAIAFGVAPAFLVYRWALEGAGAAGLIVAFVFVACGVMRLARFNVLASKKKGPATHFVGLPIPLAAGALTSLVLAHTALTGHFHMTSTISAALVTLLLAGLMVSNVRYRTFKRLPLRGKGTIFLLVIAFAAVVYASVRFNPGIVMATIGCAYIVGGITESAIGLGRKRRLRRAEIAADDPPSDFDDQ